MRMVQGILTVVLFLGYLLLWHIKRRELQKSTGVDANVIYAAQKPIQKYFAALERIMTVAVIIVIAIHAFFADRIPVAQPMDLLDSRFIVSLGFVMGILGLALCRMAQNAIGASWRVGIDDDAAPGLVTGGIYRFIRNPVYTGLFILCAGVWLINPSPLFMYWIMAFFIMMEFQVRCEEEYLEGMYGDTYREYRTRTKRYFPFIY